MAVGGLSFGDGSAVEIQNPQWVTDAFDWATTLSSAHIVFDLKHTNAWRWSGKVPASSSTQSLEEYHGVDNCFAQARAESTLYSPATVFAPFCICSSSWQQVLSLRRRYH